MFDIGGVYIDDTLYHFCEFGLKASASNAHEGFTLSIQRRLPKIFAQARIRPVAVRYATSKSALARYLSRILE